MDPITGAITQPELQKWSGMGVTRATREGRRKNIRINQILSAGPSDEAVGSRCLSSFKTKIPNIVLSLEHVHVRPRCTVYVCVRVRVVFESERECECVCFCPQTSPLMSDFRS